MSVIAKAIGLWGRERGLYRFYWGEISWKAGVGVMYWPRAWVNINIAPLNLFVHVPNKPDETPWDGPQYGFAWDWQGGGRTLWLRWGKRSKHISLPWSWTRVRHEYLAADQAWKPVPDRTILGLPGEPTDQWEQEVKYRYCLASFEVQEAVATYRVGRTEWRWKALKWLPWPRKIESAIDVSFDREIGERVGSWKGGTIGCGYSMRKNETPLECLRRMERERKFS